ncbi:uncharacterized protein LOC111313466 [Durio zibethinus]|uniref:Uncharacterized protein LOC111313466 n=1 Tax=Durio zibethinus TaxID=66656 RepID=A0A6P6AYE5_DURZI|nr:uncharacterized protein LOC111313466 [Durio zibethinus]XP_022769893.1 uncharacterized protein LOC111313466 [Durio zibethinus]
MKDLSFLLKNLVGAKMKKRIRNFYNGDGSTSTLNRRQADPGGTARKATLEEMILRLEFEEEHARAKLHEYSEIRGGRMSCVNNSDILRSARNALNQYPRFSLDGKDAMYRSSFTNSELGLRSERYCNLGLESRSGKRLRLPSTVGGDRVIWCKPGVVAKLMGLESMPVPISSSRRLIVNENSVL